MIVDGVNVLPKEKRMGLKPSGTWSIMSQVKGKGRIFCIASKLKLVEAIAVAAKKQLGNETYTFYVESEYERA